MTKWIMSVGCALLLAVALSGSGMEAEAKAKGKNKQCTYTSLFGQKSTWRCKGSERCCFDGLANKGICSTAASCL